MTDEMIKIEEDVELPTPPPPVNPLLDRVRIPGETQRLPSQGLFYTDGELSPDVKNGEVHIHPMTAYDEIVIRSVDKLFSGEAVEEVFKRCVPQVLKPLKLLAKDVDFIMVCLRKISYGSDFELKYTHTCDGGKQHGYNIEMDKFINEAKSIDPTTIAQRFTKTLPNNQTVKIHPLRYEAVIKIMQGAGSHDLSQVRQQEMLIDSLLDVIEVVDEIKDPKMIGEWLSTLPAGWIKDLSKVVDSSSDWGTEFMVTIKCKDCDNDIVMPAPMNPLTFFFS